MDPTNASSRSNYFLTGNLFYYNYLDFFVDYDEV